MEYYNNTSSVPTKGWLDTNYNTPEPGTFYHQEDSFAPLDVSQSNIEHTNYYYINPVVDGQNYNHNILSYPNQIINPAVSVQQHLFSYDQTFGSFLQQPQQQPQQQQQQHQAEEQSPISNSADDDFFDIDNIINSVDLAEEDLHQVLCTAGLSDFLFNDNTSTTTATFSDNINSDTSSYASSSAASSPKRKYSTDSSAGSFTSYSTSTISSPASSEYTSSSNGKPKRFRRSKHTKEERVVRKKDQNKKAATKYRHKKKDEKECHEQTLEDLEATQNQLTAQLDKLRTEFNVILPLAKAAFSFDASRSQQLAQLIQRLNGNNLL